MPPTQTGTLLTQRALPGRGARTSTAEARPAKDLPGSEVGRAPAVHSTAALEAVQRHRCAPFLGTLKRFGPASEGPLSFPMPGWSLAIDLPAGNPGLAPALDDLDREVASAGGRVYLAKDARLGRAALAAMYPGSARWRAERDRLDPRGVFQSDLGRRLGLCGS